MAANTAELVNEHCGTDDSKVIDNDLAGQFGLVANDTAITYNGVMSYMHTLHEKVVAAHNSLSLGSSTSVDGHILTNGVVVSNLSCGLLTTKLEVLRYGAYNSTGEDGVAITNARSVEYVGIGHDDVVVAYHYIAVNVYEGTNLHILANDGFGVDVC
jgi:hypothetical protein